MQPPHIGDVLDQLFTRAARYVQCSNIMMNVMAWRVFRNTKFGNQWVDPTIIIPSIAFQESDPNSSPTYAPSLISEIDNQWR